MIIPLLHKVLDKSFIHGGYQWLSVRIEYLQLPKEGNIHFLH